MSKESGRRLKNIANLTCLVPRFANTSLHLMQIVQEKFEELR